MKIEFKKDCCVVCGKFNPRWGVCSECADKVADVMVLKVQTDNKYKDKDSLIDYYATKVLESREKEVIR